MRVLVIGAGASGLMAAIHAAAAGAAVTVLEGMEKPGKKLLNTGNGRCNLTNTKAGNAGSYRSASPELAEQIVGAYPPRKTLEDFFSFGLFTTEKQDGCIYPFSGQASTVLEVLLMEAARRRVKIKCGEKVTALTRQGKSWKVSTKTWGYEAERVILACGSRAVPATGSDGSGYALAKALGHQVLTPLPALVPLKIRETDICSLEGLRCPAKITLITGSGRTYRDAGELQWTAYGISGIVVFQLSRFAVQALDQGQKVSAAIDLLPGQDMEKLVEKMLKYSSGKTNAEAFLGLFPKKLASFLLKRAGISENQPVTEKSVRKTLELASSLPLTVSGSRAFENAQCCMGGVPLAEIHPGTMESRSAPGVYLTGELLDADGPCGGYNLQWAWSTGAIAGNHAGA